MTEIVLIVILSAAAAYWFFNRSKAGEGRRSSLLQAEYVMCEGESPDIAYERVYWKARQKINDLLVPLIQRRLTHERQLSLGDRIAFVAAGCSDCLVTENKKEQIAGGVRLRLTVQVTPAMQRVQKLIRLAEDRMIIQEFNALRREFEQNQQEMEQIHEKAADGRGERQAQEIRRNELRFQNLLYKERLFWLWRLQQPEMVIKTCMRMLELDGENGEAYVERGRAYIKLKMFEEAQRDLDKAAALSQDQTAVAMARAELLNETGQSAEAIAKLTRLLEHARIPPVFLQRGEIYEKMTQYSQAIEDYTEALRLEPDYITAYMKRALAREVKGQTAEALHDLASVLERDPYHLGALNSRARILENQGQPEGALADLNQAILIEPEDHLSYNNRGNLHYQAGRLDLAISDYNQAIALEPADADSHFNKARALEKQGDILQAIEEYKLFLRYTPADDPVAGRIHEKLKVLLREQ